MAPKVLRVLQLIDCMHGVANREEDPAGLFATLVCDLGEEARAHKRPHDGVVRARDGEDDSACIELFGEAIRGN